MTTIFAEALSNSASAAHSSLVPLGFILTHALALLRTHTDSGIGKAWLWAVHEISNAVLWSRLTLSIQVHGGLGDPENFQFKWREFEFVRHGFNSLRETQSQYKRRTDLEFRLYLNKKENAELVKLLNNEANPSPVDEFAHHHGVLRVFRKELDRHVRTTVMKTKAATRGLVKIRRKPKLNEHLLWTVEYQVSPGKGLAEIAEADPSTISRAINDSLSLIGLDKRPDAKPGRTLGRKNKYDKNLADLGR